MPRGERTAYRATHLAPLFDEFFTCARAARETTVGRNLATQPLGYALNQEVELRRVLAGRRGQTPVHQLCVDADGRLAVLPTRCGAPSEAIRGVAGDYW